MADAARHPEAKSLAEQVMRQVGARTARELAAKIGMTKIDDERRVRSWLKGDTAPNFYGTLALLRAAGLLRTEAEADAALASAGPAAVDAAVVATALEELAALQEQEDAVFGRLEGLLSAAVGRARPRSGRTRSA